MKNPPSFSERLRWLDRLQDKTEHCVEYDIGTLTDRSLTFEHDGAEISLNFADIVGVAATDISIARDRANFTLYTYPLVTSLRWFGLAKKRQRRLKSYHFACPTADARSRWVSAIQKILCGLPVDGQIPADPRRLKIFLNPISGKQQGNKIFERVRSILENSYLEYTLHETTYAGQIQKLLSTIDLSPIDGIVLVGGDGSIHEAINGLMSRSDWQTAIRKPIGVIPAGTGNGLAKTLLDISGEPFDPVSAAFLIAKGKQRPLDIAIAQQNDRRYYSVLSLAWGMISDVDIESERLRFLGSLRTDIYALMRIWNLRSYPGKFSYIPVPEKRTSSASECQGFETCISCRVESENNIDPPMLSVEVHDVSRNKWQTIADEFILIWAMNICYATHDIKAAPNAHLSDGTMDVILVRRGISKINLLLAFLKSAQGHHLCLPGIEYYKVHCFRLDPLTNQGILAVDGEQVDYVPIQMEVKRGLARAICG